MKKLALGILLGLGAINTMADEYPLACEWNQISEYASDRYLSYKQSEIFPYKAIDKERVKIDKKNKTITVWDIDIASLEGRQVMLKENYRQDYTNFGYKQQQIIIDYLNMRYKTLNLAHFDCNGNNIWHGQKTFFEQEWRDAYPNSVMEFEIKYIIEVFGLK